MSELGGMWRIVFINRSAVQINAVKPKSTVSTRSFATEGNTLYHRNEGTHAARWREVLRSRRILSRATYSPFFTHPTPLHHSPFRRKFRRGLPKFLSYEYTLALFRGATFRCLLGCTPVGTRKRASTEKAPTSPGAANGESQYRGRLSGALN